jgi:hypothetical protein
MVLSRPRIISIISGKKQVTNKCRFLKRMEKKMPRKQKKRINLLLDDDTQEHLEWLMSRNQDEKPTNILRKAFKLYRYVMEQEEEGNFMYLEMGDDKLVRLKVIL